MLLKEFRALIREIILESTPRIPDLSREDIIEVLQDILGRDPLISYTEKLAGQFLEIKIQDGEVGSIFKDAKEKGVPHGLRYDTGGTARSLRSITLPPEMEGKTYQFEILKPDNRPDYVNYTVGDKTLAIEFTGALTPEVASKLNAAQPHVTFMSKADITRKPKPLSPELAEKVKAALVGVSSSPKMKRADKEAIESLISTALVEIFGDSILGGAPEGIFATGTSKSFKIPEASYALVQRLQAPIYAVFSEKSTYDLHELENRIASFTPEDKMAKQIKQYLEATANGLPKGFRTFFTPEEASGLLQQLESILTGDPTTASSFYRQFRRRVSNKTQWVAT